MSIGNTLDWLSGESTKRGEKPAESRRDPLLPLQPREGEGADVSRTSFKGGKEKPGAPRERLQFLEGQEEKEP